MEAIHAEVFGRVQGVSFRYHTRAVATRLGLVGWVRNRPERSVEVYAEGARPQLEALVEWLYRGPALARVDRVEVAWPNAAGESRQFEIVH